MSNALCGDSISTKRGLLAALWSIVSLLSACSFLAAFVYALTSKNEADNYNNYYNNGADASDPELAVTSRALAFSVLWTAVLAALMSVFGTVVLGFQSPLSGQYYLCCDRSVHRTTPLGLGSFIGALLMLANLTLICSVLFGEFEVGDCVRCHLSFECRISIYSKLFDRFGITEKGMIEQERRVAIVESRWIDRPQPFRFFACS